MVEPAFVTLPSWHRTLGPEVARVCELASYPADPEQRLAIDATFALTAAGKAAAATVVLIACRQNLKTGAIKQIELGWLFVTSERLVVHSAHEFDTAREAYRDLKELIDGTPVLRKRIKTMHDTPADMSIETVTGSRLVFKTRTKGAGVGKSPRKIVLDEGYALVPEHMSALRFSISAQPDPQVIVGSSAAHPESDVLRAFVQRGRTERETRLAYLEWCVKAGAKACRDGEDCTHVYGEAVGCVLDDLDALRAANPQLGKRLQEQTVRDERVECITVDLAAKFGRERAGWHDAALSDSDDPILVPVRDAWPDALDDASQIVGTVAVGFDVNPEASRAALGVYGLREDELGHAEVIVDRAGTGWIVDTVREVVDEWAPCALVLDPSGPAGRFLKAFRAMRVDPDDDDSAPLFVEDDDAELDDGQTRLVLLNGTTYAQACGAFADDVVNGRVKQIGQKPLDAALDAARTRTLGEAWAWSRRSSASNIAPLVAVTAARDGFATYGGEGSEADPWVLTV